MALALALLSVPVIASMDDSFFGNTDGAGIFDTEISSMSFPAFQDTNVDSLVVGNDKAIAFGSLWQTGFRSPKATNNLEIKKNQDSGGCAACQDFNGTCTDSCITVNLESIKVGDRDAMAFGFATATNNVKIVTNQQ